MARILRWEAPRLHTGEDTGEAKATSVDLFYDLVFAVVIAQLAAVLAEHVSFSGVIVFSVLAVPAIRQWISETLYSDRFESLDVSYRLFVFASMLVAAGMAVAVPDGLGTSFPLFVAMVVAGRVVLVTQWVRAGRAEPAVMPLAWLYLGFYAVVSAFWVAALAVPPPARWACVGLAILADLVLPVTTTGRQARLGEFSQEHLSDRFGAFFLIVAGQLIIEAILVMTRMRRPSLADMAAGVLAFALAFVLWWIYVDHVVGRPLRPGPPWNAAWVYLHIPLFMAVAGVGSAVLTFVTRGEAVVPDPVRYLLCGSFAAAVLFAGLAELALVPLRGDKGRGRRTAVVHGLPSVLAVAVGVLGGGLPAIPLLAWLLAVGLTALLAGEYFRAAP